MSQLLSDTVVRIFNEKKTFIASVRERRLQRRQQQVEEKILKSQSLPQSNGDIVDSETTGTFTEKQPYLSPIQRLVQSLPQFDQMLKTLNPTSDNSFHEEIIRRILMTQEDLHDDDEDDNCEECDEGEEDQNLRYSGDQIDIHKHNHNSHHVHDEIEGEQEIDIESGGKLSIAEMENELRDDLLEILRESSDEIIIDSNSSNEPEKTDT